MRMLHGSSLVLMSVTLPVHFQTAGQAFAGRALVAVGPTLSVRVCPSPGDSEIRELAKTSDIAPALGSQGGQVDTPARF